MDVRKQYEEEIKQAQKDSKVIVESTEQLIDMPFFEVCKFLEGKNIGELLAFRSLLQTHLDKVDMYGKTIVNSNVSSNSQKNRITIGSVFALTAKIQDRMGYIDYLVKKNQI